MFHFRLKSTVNAVAAHTCIKLSHFRHSLHACMSSDGTLAYYYEGFPRWWRHRDTPVMSLDGEIPSITVISFSTSSNSFLCSGCSYMYETVPPLSALFLYMYELPPIATVAYHEGFPRWWRHRNTPVTSLGEGIPSYTVISYDTDRNSSLFIWFRPYSETFSWLFPYMY